MFQMINISLLIKQVISYVQSKMCIEYLHYFPIFRLNAHTFSAVFAHMCGFLCQV